MLMATVRHPWVRFAASLAPFALVWLLATFWGALTAPVPGQAMDTLRGELVWIKPRCALIETPTRRQTLIFDDLGKHGWGPKSFAAGDPVQVTGWRADNGNFHAWALQLGDREVIAYADSLAEAERARSTLQRYGLPAMVLATLLSLSLLIDWLVPSASRKQHKAVDRLLKQLEARGMPSGPKIQLLEQLRDYPDELYVGDLLYLASVNTTQPALLRALGTELARLLHDDDFLDDELLEGMQPIALQVLTEALQAQRPNLWSELDSASPLRFSN